MMERPCVTPRFLTWTLPGESQGVRTEMGSQLREVDDQFQFGHIALEFSLEHACGDF